MAHAKPQAHVSLEKDKSIYSVDGFVDAWNWMLAVLLNMKGSADGKSKKTSGIKIYWKDADSPVFKLQGGGDSLKAGSGITITENEDGSKTISAHYL